MFLENLTVSSLVKKFPNLMEPQGPLPVLHTRWFPQPFQSSHLIIYDPFYYYPPIYALIIPGVSSLRFTDQKFRWISQFYYPGRIFRSFLPPWFNQSKWEVFFWLSWKVVFSVLLLLPFSFVQIFSSKLRYQIAALINAIRNRRKTLCSGLYCSFIFGRPRLQVSVRETAIVIGFHSFHQSIQTSAGEQTIITSVHTHYSSQIILPFNVIQLGLCSWKKKSHEPRFNQPTCSLLASSEMKMRSLTLFCG
jgi:hypothetical protein